MTLHIQRQVFVYEFVLRGRFHHVHIDDSFVQRTFNLHIIRTWSLLASWRALTLKCIIKCSTPRGSFRILDLQKTVSFSHNLVWQNIRYWSCSCPFIPRRFSISCDFFAVPQQLRTSRIILHLIDRSIEMARFTVRRKDFSIHNICHPSL